MLITPKRGKTLALSEKKKTPGEEKKQATF